jgi:DNA mismatch repair protein MSH6
VRSWECGRERGVAGRRGLTAAYSRTYQFVPPLYASRAPFPHPAPAAAFTEFVEAARREHKLSGLEPYEGKAKKDRYQVEVPESAVGRVPDDWTLQGKAKRRGATHCRYSTPTSAALLERLEAAEARRDDATRDGLRNLFSVFDAKRASWEAAVNCLATLDCLAALAAWSARGDGGAMCRPEVVPVAADTEPFLHLSQARHPCMAGGAGAAGSGGVGTYIPNDITLGWEQQQQQQAAEEEQRTGGPPCVLITGANAGGKSSTLRTTAMCALLAQLGCYVPAERARLTPIDRVFTRMGASDRMLAGQSTFVVELAETSAILASATRHSLVLLDELGRGCVGGGDGGGRVGMWGSWDSSAGSSVPPCRRLTRICPLPLAHFLATARCSTSTFDGCAIAYAVTRHLTAVTRCRTMFATHYHGLCEDFEGDPNVALGHMVRDREWGWRLQS